MIEINFKDNNKAGVCAGFLFEARFCILKIKSLIPEIHSNYPIFSQIQFSTSFT